jgi:hypothetical protein
VEKHSTGEGKKKIDWKSVARELQRGATACTTKWNNYQASLKAKSLKTGPFSPEEDAVIIERVTNWDTNKRGLWAALERELGRPNATIRTRWTHTLSKRV